MRQGFPSPRTSAVTRPRARPNRRVQALPIGADVWSGWSQEPMRRLTRRDLTGGWSKRGQRCRGCGCAVATTKTRPQPRQQPPKRRAARTFPSVRNSRRGSSPWSALTVRQPPVFTLTAARTTYEGQQSNTVAAFLFPRCTIQASATASTSCARQNRWTMCLRSSVRASRPVGEPMQRHADAAGSSASALTVIAVSRARACTAALPCHSPQDHHLRLCVCAVRVLLQPRPRLL